MKYYAILSEADSIEVFPDENTRSEILIYYHETEFQAKKLDISASNQEELQSWVEQKYPGINVVFADTVITQLRLENYTLRKRVDEIDEVVGRLEEACETFISCFLRG